MVFYRVNAKKAKEIYNRRRVNEHMDYGKPGLASYYKLLFVIRKLDLENVRVSYRFLNSNGLGGKHVNYLISEGILKEINIPVNKRVGISLSNKYKTDPIHAAKIRAQSIKNLEKAWKARKDNPEYKEMYEEILRKAINKRKLVVKRRIKNIKGVLIEKYDKVPEKISVRDVMDILEEYPYVLFDYPEGGKKLHMRLLLDLRSLGIDTDCRSETMRREMKNRLGDPEYREFLLKRTEEMTETRKRLYEEYPELKIESDKKSAEARKKKMRRDEDFRKMTMSNLAKGNPALWEKYRTDEKFRKRMLKKQLKGLRKGTRTVIRRAKRRRNSLNKWIIRPYFSDPFGAKPKEIERFLNTEHTEFRDEYYRDMSLYRAIKRDLQRLREEFSYSVPSSS